jgi:anti-sigma regulatory factor (Ser/Thr protein kinase)
MPRRSRQNPAVREFILWNVEKHPDSIAAVAADLFDLSRAAISGYLQRLVEAGLLTTEGNTKARRYALRTMVDITQKIPIAAKIDAEDAVWRFRVLPHIVDVKQNVKDLCHHGFTEMLNNAMDHSGSENALISYTQTYTKISMVVADGGIGIFQKIQQDFKLPDARTALLELSKGGLTSDASRHAGEGIFYTSRMFDEFQIMSHSLFYSRERQADDEWLVEVKEQQYRPGTAVLMAISTAADWTAGEVFEKYRGDNVRFRKAHVPIKISAYPGEQLVSRSQAKRVLARFDNFSEVMLDFQGVDYIGQPFADEIFRVFQLDHPGTGVYAINTGPEIRTMIEYVRRSENDGEPRLL